MKKEVTWRNCTDREKVFCPQTYFDHPHYSELKFLLQELFVDPDPFQIGKEIVCSIGNNSLAMGDFQRIERAYTRTILYRSRNGYEAMVARWSRGAIASIHGHPSFMFYWVAEGRLEIDNYKKCGDRVEMTTSEFLSSKDYFSCSGEARTFDNNIHQVRTIEETLSIHISSDDFTKGEVFSQFYSESEPGTTRFPGFLVSLRLCA